MEKFLFYGESTSSMTCIPAHRLTEMARHSSTVIFLNHELPFSSTVGSNSEYTVTLTVTEGKEEEVMKRLSKSINSSKDSFIVVGDTIAGTSNSFIDADITAIGALPAIS